VLGSLLSQGSNSLGSTGRLRSDLLETLICNESASSVDLNDSLPVAFDRTYWKQVVDVVED
jgi:hypothetical protein